METIFECSETTQANTRVQPKRRVHVQKKFFRQGLKKKSRDRLKFFFGPRLVGNDFVFVFVDSVFVCFDNSSW